LTPEVIIINTHYTVSGPFLMESWDHKVTRSWPLWFDADVMVSILIDQLGKVLIGLVSLEWSRLIRTDQIWLCY